MNDADAGRRGVMLEGFQRRALENLKKRHTDRVRAEAERIREYIGYVISDLESGRIRAASPTTC